MELEGILSRSLESSVVRELGESELKGHLNSFVKSSERITKDAFSARAPMHGSETRRNF